MAGIGGLASDSHVGGGLLHRLYTHPLLASQLAFGLDCKELCRISMADKRCQLVGYSPESWPR